MRLNQMINWHYIIDGNPTDETEYLVNSILNKGSEHECICNFIVHYSPIHGWFDVKTDLVIPDTDIIAWAHIRKDIAHPPPRLVDIENQMNRPESTMTETDPNALNISVTLDPKYLDVFETDKNKDK